MRACVRVCVCVCVCVCMCVCIVCGESGKWATVFFILGFISQFVAAHKAMNTLLQPVVHFQNELRRTVLRLRSAGGDPGGGEGASGGGGGDDNDDAR